MKKISSYQISEIKSSLYRLNYNYYIAKRLNKHNLVFASKFKLKKFIVDIAECTSQTNNIKDLNYITDLKEIKRINRNVKRAVRKTLDIITFKEF